MSTVITAFEGPLAITEDRGDGRVYVLSGENTAEAQRQAGIATAAAAAIPDLVSDVEAAGAAQVAAVEAAGDTTIDLAASIGLSYTQQSLGRSARIAPGVDWDGTLGSGWSSGEPTASTFRDLTDPAQPECAPFYPYHRTAFNGRKRLLFRVVECDPLFPVNLRIHCEGNMIDIPRDTLEHYVGDDGIERTAWLRAVDLDWSNFSMDGKCRIWAEAIPSDPTMASRILPAIEMKRKTGSLWDAVLTFGPGGTYTDWKAVYDAIQSAPFTGYDHIWAKPASSHDFDLVGVSFNFNITRWGKLLIDGEPGVTWRVHASSWATTARTWTHRCEGLVLGPGVLIDMGRLNSIAGSTFHDQPTHLAGCQLIDPNGSNNLTGNGTILSGTSTALTNPDQRRVRSAGWLGSGADLGQMWHMTECYIEGPNRSPMTGVITARNNVQRGGAEDVLSPSTGLWPGYILQHGNKVYGATSAVQRAGIAAMTVNYGGAGAVATVSVTGTNGGSTRRVNLTVDGATTQVVISTTLGSGNYYVSDVVNWINANAAGWTATLLDDSRFAATLGGAGAMAATNAKGVTVTVMNGIDLHSDCWQLTSMDTCNMIAENNQFFNCGALQIFFLSTQSNSRKTCDCVWMNNIFQADMTDPEILIVQSQIEGRMSNVRILNNYTPHQAVTVRDLTGAITSTFDDKCQIEANVHAQLVATAPVVITDLRVRYNQAVKSGAVSYPVAANVSDNLVSTTISADPIPAKVPFDLNNDARAVMSRRGVFR